MAVPTTSPAPMSPQTVGNAFVEQYYYVFHMSPEHVHRFYLDSSVLSRPDANGVMTSVTSTQAISDLVLSLDSKSYMPAIETIDSQTSHKDGIIILVTGCLMGKEEKICRRFTQSFFLAPQAEGTYFVLNDVFRFVNEGQPKDIGEVLVNGLSDDVPKEPSEQHGTDLVQDQHDLNSTTPPVEDDSENGVEGLDLSENGGAVVDEEVVVEQPTDPIQTDAPPTTEVTIATQEDLPKKSYASIVKVMKDTASPVPVYVPTTKSKPAAPKPEKLKVAAVTPAPAPDAPAANSKHASEINVAQDVEGHSIYIRNLPLNSTAEQLTEEFKKFGAIKPHGVQVRNHKIDRFCFGFVEFEAFESMQAAIKASPITIEGRQVYIDEKRTTTRVVNGVVMNGNGGGRGRYTTGRGGYRSDSYRGHGGFGSNQGYTRGEFRNHSEYSNRGEYASRGRGRAGREGYQPRGVQNGSGKVAPHSNGVDQTAAVSA